MREVETFDFSLVNLTERGEDITYITDIIVSRDI